MPVICSPAMEYAAKPLEWGLREMLKDEAKNVTILLGTMSQEGVTGCTTVKSMANNTFVVLINPFACMIEGQLLETLFHELDHVVAYYYGELFEMPGYVVYRNVRYKDNVPVDSPEYGNLPWELSATKTEKRLATLYRYVIENEGEPKGI